MFPISVLAIDDYTHFTSPIRRYPDLVVHRIVDDILEKKDPSYDSALLKKIAERCSILERTAEGAERQFMNLETANFMKNPRGRSLPRENTQHTSLRSLHRNKGTLR